MSAEGGGDRVTSTPEETAGVVQFDRGFEWAPQGRPCHPVAYLLEALPYAIAGVAMVLVSVVLISFTAPVVGPTFDTASSAVGDFELNPFAGSDEPEAGAEPATATATATATPTPAATQTGTATATGTETASSTPSATPTAAASPTPSPVPTPTASLTPTTSPTPTEGSGGGGFPTTTETATPTVTPTPTPTATPTLTPTVTPTPTPTPCPLDVCV